MKMSFKNGQELGKYVVEITGESRNIGKGEHGCVLAAKTTEGNERVAIKVIPQAEAESATEEIRVTKLALQRQLTHVVHCIDDFVFDGDFCLVMPRLGPNLDALLRDNKGPLPMTRAKPIMDHCLTAIQQVHQGLSILHGDVKAANFCSVFSEAGVLERMVIVDFGSVKPYLDQQNQHLPDFGSNYLNEDVTTEGRRADMLALMDMFATITVPDIGQASMDNKNSREVIFNAVPTFELLYNSINLLQHADEPKYSEYKRFIARISDKSNIPVPSTSKDQRSPADKMSGKRQD